MSFLHQTSWAEVEPFGHDDFGFRGSFRFDYFSSSKMLDKESNLFGLTTQVEILPKISESIDGKAEVWVMNPKIGRNSDGTISIQEVYVTEHFSVADFRIGKQIVVWGRADAVNPTDNLTSRNYTILLPFDEDQRTGTNSLKLDYFLTPEYTFTIFSTPFFKPSKIPIAIPPDTVLQEHLPSPSLSNNEVGLKINKSGEGNDWSLSYFHGFNLIPEIRLIEESSTGTVLQLNYPQIDVFGSDIAQNYGRFGLRAEAAYFIPKNYEDQIPTSMHPYLYYVAGVDRSFFENLNINLQIVGRYVSNFQNPQSVNDPVQRSVATANAIFFGQQYRNSYGFTFRIHDNWGNNTLEAECVVVAYLNPYNSYIRPLVTYSFTDQIKGSIGGEIYSGPKESYFGGLKDNQGNFIEMRYNF